MGARILPVEGAVQIAPRGQAVQRESVLFDFFLTEPYWAKGLVYFWLPKYQPREVHFAKCSCADCRERRERLGFKLVRVCGCRSLTVNVLMPT